MAAHDFVRIILPGHEPVMLGALVWPPPERVEWADVPFVRTSYSQITDEEIAKMTHVARGAVYEPAEGVTAEGIAKVAASFAVLRDALKAELN